MIDLQKRGLDYGDALKLERGLGDDLEEIELELETETKRIEAITE